MHKRLTTIYGTKFTATFLEPESVQNWCEAWGGILAGITGEQIKFALGRMEKEMVWPPNAVEFYQLCKAAPVPQALQIAFKPARTAQGAAISTELVQGLQSITSKRPSALWAVKILEREQAGEHISVSVRQLAQDAITKGKLT